MRFQSLGGGQPAERPTGEQAGAAPPEPRKRKKKKLPKVISGDEASRLFAALDDSSPRGIRDRCMLELMYRAGLRVGEVVRLDVRDVEPDGIVRLYDAKGGDGTAYFDPERIMPLIDRWLAVRHELSQGRLGARLFCHGPGRGVQAGDDIATRYVQRLVKRLKVDALITGKCTPHVLRHTYATELIEEGYTLPEVSTALRHANLQTTAVYLHVRDESLRRKISGRTSRPEATEGR